MCFTIFFYNDMFYNIFSTGKLFITTFLTSIYFLSLQKPFSFNNFFFYNKTTFLITFFYRNSIFFYQNNIFFPKQHFTSTTVFKYNNIFHYNNKKIFTTTPFSFNKLSLPQQFFYHFFHQNNCFFTTKTFFLP